MCSSIGLRLTQKGIYQMSKPILVVISDIHFSVNTLEKASYALSEALKTARSLTLPLIIAGDLTDTKAIIRAEVANKLIEIFTEYKDVETTVIIGNHDLINEKGKEHSLKFLKPYVKLVEYTPHLSQSTGVYLMPYFSDNKDLEEWFLHAPSGQKFIMHQGFQGAFMGDYVQDKTSISPELVKNFKVISGHYHKHQTVGTVTYIGSPYTMSFGEANDGPKGFLILNEDFTFERVILNLPKHVIMTAEAKDGKVVFDDRDHSVSPHDSVWVKIRGPKSELSNVDKIDLGKELFGHANFKLDMLPTAEETIQTHVNEDLTDIELLDNLINMLSQVPDDKKDNLKRLFRDLTKSSRK